MDRKYEFTGETENYAGVTLHRIKAVRDFNGIKEGSLGGWIEDESNLSHDGGCWIYEEAKVYGYAWVGEHAEVFENAWFLKMLGF